MGHVYSVEFDQVSVAAAQDLFSVKALATGSIKILGIFLSESNKAQDANDAQQRWRIRRGQTTQGSGGTTPTPSPITDADVVAASTVHTNDTTQGSAGTIVILHNDIFNIRAGLSLWLPEKLQFTVVAGHCLTVEFPAAPAAALTMNGTLYYEEML